MSPTREKMSSYLTGTFSGITHSLMSSTGLMSSLVMQCLRIASSMTCVTVAPASERGILLQKSMYGSRSGHSAAVETFSRTRPSGSSSVCIVKLLLPQGKDQVSYSSIDFWRPAPTSSGVMLGCGSNI